MSSYTGYRHSLVNTKLLRADWPDRGILQKITRSLLTGAQGPYQKSFNLPAFTGAFKKCFQRLTFIHYSHALG